MVKVLTGAQPGQLSEAEAQVVAGAPTAELKERVPQAEGFDSLLQEASLEDVTAGIEAGAQQEIAHQQQLERDRVPTLHERAQDTETVHEWDTPVIAARKLKEGKIPPARPDLGLKKRSEHMASMFSAPDSLAALSVTPTKGREHLGIDHTAVAEAQAEHSPGSLVAAMHRMNAVSSVQDPETRSFSNTIDPMFLSVLSAVTENSMAEMAFGEDTPVEGLTREAGDTPPVAKYKGNSALGQQINREYQRIRNAQAGRPTHDYTDLPNDEATVLGDAAKEMFAIANPELAKITTVNNQSYVQLTPTGVKAMSDSAWDRKRLFPKQHVRTLKSPQRSGRIPGEIGRVHKRARKYTGKVRSRTPAGAEVIEEATRNLSQVANVVDPQRLRILLTTALPVLSGQVGPDSPLAEINNVGSSKVRQYEAQKASQDRRRLAAQSKGEAFREAPYDPQRELEDEMNRLAQQVRGIVQERKGANFLTYSVQSATGRIMPQQTNFDPTTSKAARFVTRNAVPAVAKPGSRIDNNLRQMYALMLVQHSHIENPLKPNKMLPADALLPRQREIALQKNTRRLEAWGDRLQEVLNSSISM